MNKCKLSLVALALAASSAAFAAAPNIQGGASTGLINVTTPSNAPFLPPAALGYAGIQVGGSYSIDMLAGPISQASSGPWGYLPPAMGGGVIAQVWNNTSNTVANTYSLRQVTAPPAAMPAFGGLVIGQVKDASGVAYARGAGVYFGEWSPQGTPVAYPTTSTDLNMASTDRTVWYTGDNAVTTTPTLASVTYAVVGIQQVGVGAGNAPSAPNLYSGTLTANYNSGLMPYKLTGVLNKTGGSITIDANILSNGQFVGTATQGRFYNGATALAGIYTGSSGAGDDVAYGGRQTGGTITP